MNTVAPLRYRSLATACWAVAACAACGSDEPWYDTSPDSDLSYLPLGDVEFETATVSWLDGDRSIAVDAYVPTAGRAPVVLMMPGAFVIKERYRWLGVTLASHGVATFVVQPRAAFATSRDVLGTLEALAESSDLPTLRDRLDLDRVILAGHSAGGVAPVGLVDVAGCAAGICVSDDVTPPALRGLLLFGYHNQALDTDRAPMAAADVPWLVISGSRDGLATPEKVATTIGRIDDRPLHGIQITGANHYQLTDYVDPAVDLRLPDDLEPAIANRDARATAARYAVRFALRYVGSSAPVVDPVASDLGAAEDARVMADTRLPRLQLGDPGWPRVARARRLVPLLDDSSTAADVVASAEFLGDRYLLVRDAALGARVLRFDASGVLGEVAAPGGAAGGFYGNSRLDGLLGAMAVFRDELYVGVSSGVQGAELRSTGAEVWAWNGARWRAVVSRATDTDPSVVVSALRGCAAGDGNASAEIEVSGVAWNTGAWRGGTVDDVGSPTADATKPPLVWSVLDNTSRVLVVQANDRANDSAPEDTVCDRLRVGDTLYLRNGRDESGFGEPWNKGIAAMAVFEDRLYIGSALNYEDGAELYATADGVTFETVIDRARLGFHPSGVPITTSISALHVSNVTGAPRLMIGGTGSMDYGARLFALVGGHLTAVIDDAIDEDDVGLDEAGLSTGNHQISSMADFGGRLWVATLHFDGSELVSSNDGITFRRDVGAGSALGPGWGDSSQLAGRLVVASGYLWVIDVAFVQTAAELREKSGYVFRSRDGVAWQLVTAHAFGTNAVQVSQLFPEPGSVDADARAPLVAVTSGAALAQPQIFRPLRIYTVSDHAEEESR